MLPFAPAALPVRYFVLVLASIDVVIDIRASVNVDIDIAATSIAASPCIAPRRAHDDTHAEGDLEKRGAIKIEEFTDAALSDFNFAVNPVGRKIDKECRNFGQQPFESQRLVEFCIRLDF
jgi:hypothetical protein